ncbi:MAG: restriction endonuclease subunit S [Rhodocyclaceae bacterium]|nr:restriction endonuclease subunit S [Rhodocyclaceae bacterium]
MALAVGAPTGRSPRGWQWRLLTDLARLESGHTPSRQHPEYWGGDIPWISIPDAKRFHGRIIEETAESTNALGIANSSARLIPEGTVCLSRTASVGYVTVTGRPMATSQDFVNWICGDQLLPRFLQYLLIAEGQGLLRFASGAVHKTIYFPEVKAFHVCVPGVSEQRRIVAILDEAFEGVATAKAHAERNLRNVREVQDGYLANLFSSTQNWTMGPLSSFVESISTGPFGSMLHKSDYVDDGVPLVNPINIVGGSIVPTKEKQVDEATAVRLRSYLLRSGDIVVGRRGEIGRCAVVSDTQYGWLCGTGCFFIRPTSDVEPSFMAHLIRSAPYRTRLEALSTGTTMQNLSNGALSGLEVSLPSLAEQKRLLAAIDAVSFHTDQMNEIGKRKLAALDELKRTLLHQAFSGQL